MLSSVAFVLAGPIDLGGIEQRDAEIDSTLDQRDGGASIRAAVVQNREGLEPSFLGRS